MFFIFDICKVKRYFSYFRTIHYLCVCLLQPRDCLHILKIRTTVKYRAAVPLLAAKLRLLLPAGASAVIGCRFREDVSGCRFQLSALDVSFAWLT